MPITRADIENRLAVAKRQLEQIKEQYHQTLGAITDIEFWLKEDDKPSEPEVKD